MTDENAPVRRHIVTAKEHLAGIKAAQAYHHALAERHLLDTQQPVKDQPVPEHETKPA